MVWEFLSPQARQARSALKKLNTAREARDSGQPTTIDLYREVFSALGQPEISPETWRAAYSDVAEYVGVLSKQVQSSREFHSRQREFDAASDLLRTRLDNSHKASQQNCQRAILHHVDMQVAMAEQITDYDARLAACQGAEQVLVAAEIDPNARGIAELAHDVRKRLASQLLAIGVEFANQNRDEDAAECYRRVHVLLAKCESPKIAVIWNAAVDRQIELHARRCQTAQQKNADDEVLNECRSIRAIWKTRRKAAHKDDRSLPHGEAFANSAQRLAEQYIASGNGERAAELLLELIENLDETQAANLYAVDRLGQVIKLQTWASSPRYKKHLVARRTENEKAILTRWLAHCSKLLPDTAPADTATLDAAARLLDNCRFLFSEVGGAQRQICVQQLRLLLAQPADASSIVSEARPLLKDFGLKVNLSEPHVTLDLWQLALPALLEREPRFLTGDRVLALVDLVEKQRSKANAADVAASERLKAFRRLLYRHVLTFEHYEECDYENFHTPTFGFLGRAPSAPLDYFFCLDMAEDALRSNDVDRAKELCKLVAKRFEALSDSEKLKAFPDRYFKIVDSVVATSDRRSLLGLVLRNELKETRLEACRRLLQEYEQEARHEVEEGHYLPALQSYKSALDCVKLLTAEYLFVPEDWKKKREEVLSCLIHVSGAVSASFRESEPKKANEYLLEALRFLRQCDREARPRADEQIEILGKFVLGPGAEVAPEKTEAELCFQHAEKLLNAQSVNAAAVLHFLRLAFLAEVIDEAAYNFHCGRCHLSVDRIGDAKPCFHRALDLLPGRKRSDSGEMKTQLLYRLAVVARREMEASDDEATRLTHNAEEVEYLGQAVSTNDAPPQWNGKLVAALHSRAKFESRKRTERQADLVQALHFLARWQRLDGDTAAIDDLRAKILSDLSDAHLVTVKLQNTDAAFCLQRARDLIKRGHNVADIEHFLKLARHGGAVNQAGFDYEMGCAQQANKNLDEARHSFSRVGDADKSLASKARHRLGEVEFLAAQNASTEKQRHEQLQQAIAHLMSAQAMDAQAFVDDDLAACYLALYRLQRVETVGADRLRHNVVSHNETLRKAFEHYDRAHEKTGSAQTRTNLSRLGGGIAYLMLAASARSAGDDAVVKRYLERCAEVFPDTAAGKLARMIQLRVYPKKNIGVENRSTHNLPLAHYKLATVCADRRMLASAEFLLSEAARWDDYFREKKEDVADIDRSSIESYQRVVSTLIEGEKARAVEDSEPSADDLGWRDIGTFTEIIKANLEAAKELANVAGDWVPSPVRIALTGADYILKTFVSGSQEEAALAQMDYGRQLMGQLYPHAASVADADIAKLGADVTSKAAALEGSALQFELRVEPLQQVNAFAVPGGFIVISQELLEFCGADRDQLAFVIGHEAAHILKHHYIYRMIGGNLLERLKKYGRENLIQLLSAGLSQDHELEADRLGVQFAHAAGYDPQGSIRFFVKLKARAQERSFTLRFFSSHPPHATRIQEVEDVIRRLKPRDPHSAAHDP